MAENTQREAYKAFEEKVRRTVFLCNISPKVTEAVLKMAVNQFANVTSVHFITNYTSTTSSRSALVEVKSPSQANSVVAEMTNLPFMVSGMPRPVRAHIAHPEMFDNRPSKPSGTLRGVWLSPSDPDFEIAKNIRQLLRKHEAESTFLLQHQMKEEEELAKQQDKILNSHYQKLDAIDRVFSNGSARRLAAHYGMRDVDAK